MKALLSAALAASLCGCASLKGFLDGAAEAQGKPSHRIVHPDGSSSTVYELPE